MNSALERAKRVKAAVFDGDGVVFTGHVFEGMEGGFGKVRSHADGQGISLLRAIGFPVACVTGEGGKSAVFLVKLAEKWNSLPSVREGRWHPVTVFEGAEKEKKVEIVTSWLAEKNLTLQECAAMGDDLTDYHLLKAVGGAGGLAAAPAQAEEAIKKLALFTASRRGGDGAIRDLANFILEAKGIDATTLSLR